MDRFHPKDAERIVAPYLNFLSPCMSIDRITEAKLAMGFRIQLMVTKDTVEQKLWPLVG
jgi:hypothetical protein